MSKKNILLLTILAILTLLVYTVDLFKLNYQLAGWEEFGEPPILISHVEYLIADTPNIIGYLDHSIGEEVTCFAAVAFVEADTGETYRCCDAGELVSCLEGDFSSDIPASDEQCISELKNIFGVPDTIAGAKEYQVYGDCLGGRFAELTVMQLDENGKVRWKHIRVDTIQVMTSALRCVVGPALLLIIAYILYRFYQEKTAQPVRKLF